MGGLDFDGAYRRVQERSVDEGALGYLEFHAERYRHLAAAVAGIARSWPEGDLRALDIGPGFQTEILRLIWPQLTIDTMGFEDERLLVRPGERHFPVDLNATAGVEAGGPYDLVLMCEVIEHLYTNAVEVLSFVRRWVRPGGSLVVQTPNAVALPRRIRMLAGRSPFEPVRDDRRNPGHFHEFTAPELAADATAAGFTVAAVQTANHFGATSALQRAYNRLVSPVLPSSMRSGITMTLRAP